MSNAETNRSGTICSMNSMNQTFYTCYQSNDYHKIIHKQWQH